MKTERLLVIDDDLDVGLLVEEVARQMGLSCSVTTDAESFLRELSPDITLVLLDLVIPGTDGVEILRQLSRRECGARIILMSGISKRVIESASTLGESLGLSIAGHLAKPFHLNELEALIASQVESKKRPSLRPGVSLRFDDDELLRAITRDELVLHYQPQVNAATGEVVGVEGLVRWEEPTRGLIFPDHFIQRVEDLGLIDQLTFLVFEHGLSEVGLFSGVYPQLTVSFNVSESSLRDLDFTNRFVSLVEQHNFKPGNVILEITESGLIRELSRTLDVLTRLRMKKVQLSIDDFGNGYSMMQQLRNVPATEIKIDKSIVQNIQNESDRIIVQKTIELGHDLGMKVVGEGVETREQLSFLRDHGCDIIQGYLFCKPLPSVQLLRWLEEYRSNRR